MADLLKHIPKAIAAAATYAAGTVTAAAQHRVWAAVLLALLAAVTAIAVYGPMILVRWADAIRYLQDDSPDRTLGPALSGQLESSSEDQRRAPAAPPPGSQVAEPTQRGYTTEVTDG